MNDLISRSTLNEKLKQFADDNEIRGYDTAYDVVMDCIGLVDDQPTAYDVDKVIEEVRKIPFGSASLKVRVLDKINGGSLVGDSFKPKSHADYIRSMSDEQLAEFLSGIDLESFDEDTFIKFKTLGAVTIQDKPDVLEWLQKPPVTVETQ